MLNILVFGAGAIGCFLGSKLAEAGHHVTLVGRQPLVQTVTAYGLSLLPPGQPMRLSHPHAVTSLTDLTDRFDLILLTVKLPDIMPAIEQLIASNLDLQQSQFVTWQNGLGSEDQVMAAFGADRVLSATITMPIRVPEVGMVEISKAKGGLGVAAITPAGNQAKQQLAEAFTQAELSINLYEDYRAMKWSKLLLNIINNATSAILDQPPAEIINQPVLFDLEIEALQEGLSVMRAVGVSPVDLPGYPTTWLARLLTAPGVPKAAMRTILRPFMAGGRGNKMPSLHLDLAAGRSKSEIGYLNGAIVRAGQAYGVATPVNTVLTRLLSGLVAGELLWADYQQQPAKLLTTVAVERFREEKIS